jgi:hypothetical protein
MLPQSCQMEKVYLCGGMDGYVWMESAAVSVCSKRVSGEREG